jgi:hypothetical protein
LIKIKHRIENFKVAHVNILIFENFISTYICVSRKTCNIGAETFLSKNNLEHVLFECWLLEHIYSEIEVHGGVDADVKEYF